MESRFYSDLPNVRIRFGHVKGSGTGYVSSTARDVIFQVFDRVLVFSNNRLDDVANRNDSDQLVGLYDRKVSHPFVCK